MVSLRRIKRLNRERDSKSCEISIEHDSSPRLRSSGAQCRVLLDSSIANLQPENLYRKKTGNGGGAPATKNPRAGDCFNLFGPNGPR